VLFLCGKIISWIRFRNPQESKKDSFGEEGRVRERKSGSFITANPFVRYIENASLFLPGSHLQRLSQLHCKRTFPGATIF
jgi:hypothetical protein